MELDRWFDAVMGDLRVPVLMLGPSGRVAAINNSALDILGLKRDGAIGRDWPSCFGGSGEEAARKAFEEASGGGSPVRARLGFVRDGGRAVTWVFNPVRGGEGELEAVMCVGEDAVHALSAPQEAPADDGFIHSLLESVSHPLYVIDASSFIVKMANSAAGFGELDGTKTCYRLVHNSDTPCQGNNVCPLAEVKRTKKPVTVRHVKYDRDGRERHIKVRGYPVFDSAGEVAQVIEHTFEITDQELTERELRKSRRRYIDIIENTAEAIIEINGEGTIHIWNRAAEKIFGYSASEAIGANLTMIIPPEYREAHKAGLRQAMLTGKGAHIGKAVELEGLRKGGGRFPVELLISLTNDDEGGRRFTGILRDLTEKKKSRERLIRAESLSAVGTFISGVAHELNNPLTAVLGFSESVMSDHELSPKAADEMKIVVGEARRSVDIVRGLLNFVRKQPAEKTAVSLNELVESVINLKKYQLRVENIELITSLSQNLRPVRGEAGQLRQILLNLVQNAHHAVQEAGAGGVIRITSYQRANRVFVEVYNSGPRIPEDVMPNIFEPFFTTKTKEKGTGLGLAISYGIAREHGGDLSVKNSADGVVFVLDLPSCSAAETGCGGKHETKTPDGKDKVALIVDDEASVRALLTKYLRKMGFKVLSSSSGDEAIGILDGGEVDMAVVDLLMPGMDGFEFYGVVEKRWPYLKRRIIFATGMVEERAALFAEAAGCRILEKPFEKERLYEAVEAILAPAPNTR